MHEVTWSHDIVENMTDEVFEIIHSVVNNVWRKKKSWGWEQLLL